MWLECDEWTFLVHISSRFPALKITEMLLRLVLSLFVFAQAITANPVASNVSVAIKNVTSSDFSPNANHRKVREYSRNVYYVLEINADLEFKIALLKSPTDCQKLCQQNASCEWAMFLQSTYQGKVIKQCLRSFVDFRSLRLYGIKRPPFAVVTYVRDPLK